MPSLQKPKKMTFLGSDGAHHPFLAKPKDDLRKDYRLMDFAGGRRWQAALAGWG
jgi:serine/threonine-protein kinase ATR